MAILEITNLAQGQRSASPLMDPGAAEAEAPPRPRTLTVLALLVTAALVLSYLCAYALIDALRYAEVLSPWTAGNDPRPKWMLISFSTLLTTFAALAGVFRLISRHQLRRIDALAEEM